MFEPPPRPRRVLDVPMRDGAVIRVRQHGHAEGPRLLVSHGNALASDGYYPFWRHFVHDCEVLVYDQRNHGQNPRHREDAHCVASFVDDLATLLRELPEEWGSKPTFGVFHSLSAVVAVAHALAHPWPWDGLVLFDPPFCPAPDDPLYDEARTQERTLAERAARRRPHFDHPDELAAKLEQAMGGPDAPAWVPGAYEGMARAVLRERDSGGFELACPGAFEAKIFAENSTLSLTPRLGELPGPLLFLCADPERPGARGPALVNRRLATAHGHRYHAPPGATHMLQLEQPHQCAQLTRRFLQEQGVLE